MAAPATLYAGQFPAGYLPRHDFSARDRQGPSVLDQSERCMRSWGLRYLVGFDSQEPEWSDIAEHVYDPPSRTWRGVSVAGAYTPVPSRKRSTALGTESHRIAGAFYEGKPSVPGYKTWAEAWASFPGQVAQAWLDVMPAPDECDQVFSELPVALYPNPEGEDLPGGLVLEGTSDLLLKLRHSDGLISNRKAFSRHVYGVLEAAGLWLAADFKTTRDWRYQKTPEGLRTDKQGVIYLLAAMRRLDLTATPGRWAYSITDVRKRREARATDFVQTREHAETAVAGYFRQAAVLKGHHRAFAGIRAGGDCTADQALADRLTYAQALPADTTRCDDFGGCPHSWERGGACMARRLLSDRAVSAPAKPDVPLAALLQRSVDAVEAKKTTGPKGPNAPPSGAAKVTHMSIWKQRAEMFKAQSAAMMPAAAAPPVVHMAVGGIAPPALVAVAQSAEVLSAPMLGQKQTVLVNVPAGETPFELVPAQPAAEPAAAPRGRGRPPGAKNKAKAAAIPAEGSPEYEALPMAQQADADQARHHEALSEAAARELLNTPLPRGAVPAVELARVQALAGGDAAEDHPPCPPPYTQPLFDVGFTHYADSPNAPSCMVSARVPRHRVAAAAEAIDAFVRAVFPTPESA